MEIRMNRRTLIKSLLGTLALSLSLTAQAQDGPPIRILVGFAPGGLTDIVARLFAEKLRVELNQPVLVENRPGAGGRLASQALKASPPDGRTFMVAPNSGPVFLEIFYPRAQLGFAMVVQRSLGVRNVQEYMAWAKANPKQAFFGAGGAGGQGHFIGSKLGQAIGVDLQVVPYKGNGPVNIDMLGGQLPAAILPASDFMQHRNSQTLQILGVFEDKRSPLAPDVPTFAEQGLKFDAGQAWMGVWTSARAPGAEVDRMQNALRKILASTEFNAVLESRFTMSPMFRSAAQMDKLQRAELEMWRPVIKASGFTPG